MTTRRAFCGWSVAVAQLVLGPASGGSRLQAQPHQHRKETMDGVAGHRRSCRKLSTFTRPRRKVAP